MLAYVSDGPTRGSVHRTYERIADHFAATRTAGWPEIETFLEGRRVDTACDLGCANGRHFGALGTVATRVAGLDFVRPLLVLASERMAGDVDCVQGDVVSPPFQADTFELALFVATLHHVPSRADRVRALDELARILQGNGLISVWSVTADRFDFQESRDQYVPWTLPDGEIVERYYHLYDRADFAAELEDSRLHVRSIEASSGNWYAVVRSD